MERGVRVLAFITNPHAFAYVPTLDADERNALPGTPSSAPFYYRAH